MPTKWVGFDMDECIGSVMPLYTFVVTLPRMGVPRRTLHTCVKQCLYLSERAHETWLLRPAIYGALDRVYKAFKTGQIAGAFVFSNNGSADLVQFVSDFLNYWMYRKHRDFSRPQIFQMAVCRGSPLRSPGSLEKSYAEIVRALERSGLPLPSSPQDLLFFDDMEHTLQSETPHYVQVRAYMNTCPIDRIISALTPCAEIATPEIWEKALSKARGDDPGDRRDGALSMPPTVKDTRSDAEAFETAFDRFLSSAGGGATRRRRRRGGQSTRRLGGRK